MKLLVIITFVTIKFDFSDI